MSKDKVTTEILDENKIPVEIDVELDEREESEDHGLSLTLEDFLTDNVIEGETEKVILCERLKDYEFEIGSMNKKQYDQYIKASIKRAKNGRVLSQDDGQFHELIVINHCLYPNFKKLDFINKLKVSTPSEALNKVLKIGEIRILADKILRFNGFDNEEYEREAAKN